MFPPFRAIVEFYGIHKLLNIMINILIQKGEKEKRKDKKVDIKFGFVISDLSKLVDNETKEISGGLKKKTWDWQ